MQVGTRPGARVPCPTFNCPRHHRRALLPSLRFSPVTGAASGRSGQRRDPRAKIRSAEANLKQAQALDDNARDLWGRFSRGHAPRRSEGGNASLRKRKRSCIREPTSPIAIWPVSKTWLGLASRVQVDPPESATLPRRVVTTDSNASRLANVECPRQCGNRRDRRSHIRLIPSPLSPASLQASDVYDCEAEITHPDDGLRVVAK